MTKPKARIAVSFGRHHFDPLVFKLFLAPESIFQMNLPRVNSKKKKGRPWPGSCLPGSFCPALSKTHLSPQHHTCISAAFLHAVPLLGLCAFAPPSSHGSASPPPDLPSHPIHLTPRVGVGPVEASTPRNG